MLFRSIYNFNKSNCKIRDIRCKATEWVTLDLIEEDKEIFSDIDFIFYFHTKGVTKINSEKYKNIISWRNIMQYFNIEKVKNVFKLFEKTDFNTYGVLYNASIKDWKLYSGNFWWMKGDYAKTLNSEKIKKTNRYTAEYHFVGCGKNFNPFSAYDRDGNHYDMEFKKEEYGK